MSCNTADSGLGKRKRVETVSGGERSQARIDRYFAAKPVKPTPLISVDCALASDSIVQHVQGRCDSAPASQGHKQTENHLLTVSVQQAPLRQIAGQSMSSDPESTPDCAVDLQSAETHGASLFNKQSTHKGKAAVKGAAAQLNWKPVGAIKRGATDASLKSSSIAALQPDLAEHLSVFLSALKDRQQFRE